MLHNAGFQQQHGTMETMVRSVKACQATRDGVEECDEVYIGLWLVGVTTIKAGK